MEGGVAAAVVSFASGFQHASQLVPALREVIRRAGWGEEGLADVEALYVSIGPGSFTGLRVAVMLVKGLWLARELAGGPPLGIVAVPTLRVIVENLTATACDGDEAAVVLDAKRGQIFTASYRHLTDGAGWHEVRPPRLDTLASVVAEAHRRGVGLRLTGEGLAYHAVPESDRGWVKVAGADAWWPRAEVVGRLGYAMVTPPPGAGPAAWADAETLEPLYVRLPEAQEKLLENRRDTVGRGDGLGASRAER